MSKRIKQNPKIEIEQDDSFGDYLSRHNVKPLTQDKKYISRPKSTHLPTKRTTVELEPMLFEDNGQLQSVAAEEVISFARPDLSHKIVRRLRSGKFQIEATLDLHGLTASKAEKQLAQFLTTSEQQNRRCILIIHGKGKLSEKPILKNKLNSWLRHLPQILAFCSAKPMHGGQGAIYVLLRKTR